MIGEKDLRDLVDKVEHIHAACVGMADVQTILDVEIQKIKERLDALERRWPSGVWGRTKLQ